jgi:hypothetical protein
MYSQGFHYEYFPITFYPPFSFQSHALYASKDRILAGLPEASRQKIKQLEPECNISAFVQTNSGREQYSLASLTKLANGDLEILIGSRTVPDTLLRYSSFRKFAGAKIPGAVDVTVYRQVTNRGSSGSGVSSVRFVVARQFRFRLLSAKQIKPDLTPFDVRASIPIGTLVSYSSDRGQCGVVFNPSAGPLEDQIAAQLKEHNIKGSRLVQSATVASPRGQLPLVPLALSGAFGVAALVLFLKRRR